MALTLYRARGGLDIPIWILGSSIDSARLAAEKADDFLRRGFCRPDDERDVVEEISNWRF